jgi:hypothetical protein
LHPKALQGRGPPACLTYQGLNFFIYRPGSRREEEEKEKERKKREKKSLGP